MTGQVKLLVLVDGSERTIQTAHYLTGFLPVNVTTRIVLFHVHSGLPEEFRELEQDAQCAGLTEQLRGQKQEETERVLACLEQARKILIDGGYAEDCVQIKVQRLVKGVARDIIEEARHGYSAVVLRRRGFGAFKNLILGSVAVKLLQALTFLPIILVGQAPPVRKVLLAVDSSPHSRKAVEFACALLGGYGYEVHLFHAVIGLGAVRFDGLDEEPLDAGESSPEQPEQPEQTERTEQNCIKLFKAKVARLIHTATDLLVESGFDLKQIVRTVHSGVSHSADAIVAEAERTGCSTIVVGRRGLTRTEAFFMGRVSHAVIYGGKQFSVWVV